MVGMASNLFAINQWAYINPSDPSKGVYETSTPCPGGGGTAGPMQNWWGIDLTQAYLINADLRWSGFTNCTLTNAEFTNANLTGASFSNCDLTDANFTGATITGIYISYVTGFTPQQLYGTVDYQAKNLSGIHLSNVNLTGGNFAGQNLRNANLSSDTLTNVDFTNADLLDASLYRCSLSGTNFTGATITGISFSGATGFTAEQLYPTASYQSHDLSRISLMDFDMTNANFVGQNLSNVSFNNSTFTNADFSNANLTDASMLGVTLTNAIFTGATINGARLDHASGLTPSQIYSTASYQAHDLSRVWLGSIDLTSANFVGQNLSDAFFVGAKLTNADFTNANLTNAEMEETTISGAILTGATVNGTRFTATASSGFLPTQLYSTASYHDKDLSGIQIRNSDVSGWNFSGQNLSRTDLSGTNLTATDFTNANLSTANLSWGNLAGTNFTGAIVNGMNLWLSTGFTLEQLYSTASYQTKDLSGVQFSSIDLTGANFAGQDLRNAIIGTILTNADLRRANLQDASLVWATLTGTDMRHSTGGNIDQANLHNTILPDGTINNLSLASGEKLFVRNDTMPIHVSGTVALDPASSLQLLMDDSAWGSTISFTPGNTVLLSGEISLNFLPGVDSSSHIGEKFQLFDWTGTPHEGTFNVVSNPGCVWNLDELYTAGRVSLVAVPEPSAITLLGIGILALASYVGLGRKSN
jgi:uncharacterized protein YjbI with pentapeptide repeats